MWTEGAQRRNRLLGRRERERFVSGAQEERVGRRLDLARLVAAP